MMVTDQIPMGSVGVAVDAMGGVAAGVDVECTNGETGAGGVQAASSASPIAQRMNVTSCIQPFYPIVGL